MWAATIALLILRRKSCLRMDGPERLSGAEIYGNGAGALVRTRT